MSKITARSIHVTGLVQGVGFRPFIYRLATECRIRGWVENGNDGVRIHAEGGGRNLDRFLRGISKKAPAAAQISNIKISEARHENHGEFRIRKSADYSDEITEISPDIGVCKNCIEDMRSQPHRLGYPFINCTNCGPRFSIIKGLPYDRAKTTMEPFQMCPVCESEYLDVSDRRFHAQPVACNTCGPHYRLVYNGRTYTGTGMILEMVCKLIMNGKVVAIKGTGGFHLACNAMDESAVGRLRQRKYREGKPFAVMFKNIDEIRRYMHCGRLEENLLVSWRRPIVVLQNDEKSSLLARSVSNGFSTTGVMLPYMPFHYLLFGQLDSPAIVLTSGNLSDEPVIIDDRESTDRLKNVADAFLLYNRDIHNRTDDSVMFVAGGKERLIRRSRGYAPSPVNLEIDADGIIAAGAELVNCFCIGKGNKAIMSQHIGDLKNLETLDFYQESMSRFTDMFRVKPGLVVCDLHPDYLSTRFAEELASRHQIKLTRVQHHHSHIASCMAEHGLDEKVIGISMDGVGMGDDGNIWGFEVMVCDLAGYERKIHLEYVPQPGGDMATFEPWRMAVAYLHRFVTCEPEKLDLPFLKAIPGEKIRIIKTALDNKLNAPLTSSAGRLFDAVAGLTGICLNSSFHAEAPMRLENIVDPSCHGRYRFGLAETIDPGPVILDILRDLKKNVPPGTISARFHRAVVEVLVRIAESHRDETGLNRIVLSGGTFQNRFLLTETEKRLRKKGFQVYSQERFPSNDGGIALGQLVIAAKKKNNHFAGDH